MTHVLLVEDDPWMSEGLITALEAADYTVAYAAHAQAAITRLDERVPDVIVADMMLTGTTVLALLHELQSYSDTQTIPVVLCTNSVDLLKQDSLRAYGIRRVIDKATMHPQDVTVAVRAVL